MKLSKFNVNLLLFQHGVNLLRNVVLQNTPFLFMVSAEENHVSSDKEEGGEIQLEMVELTLGTLDLREYEICPSRHRRRRRRKKEETAIQNDGRPSPVSATL